MCWNQEVSLNTFLFSGFVLGLVIYNNAYTQYKIRSLNNIWVYLFIFIVISMQLIEFFIWRNIQNDGYNRMFTIIAYLIICVQPAASLMLLSDEKIRNYLLIAYLFLAIPYISYMFLTNTFKVTVTPLGHLNWNFNSIYPVFYTWCFFFFFSFFYERKWPYLIFGLITVLLFMYKYSWDKSMGSMWCWFINSSALFLAAYLLFYLPYKGTIC
jgi:hypothetical protein